MKAAVYYENGGPEVLRYEEVGDPEAAAHEVLIEVRAIGRGQGHRDRLEQGEAQQASGART